MESKGSEPGLDSREPSFSSYCSNTVAETAARVSMEESSVQYHLDYDFDFNSLPLSNNNVFPVFNHTALLLNKQDKQVEAIQKDNTPLSLDAKKPEGVQQPVHYKRNNSIGSLSRQWSFKCFLRRSNSLAAPTNTNNNNIIEEEKEGIQQSVHYKKSNSIGSLLRHWSFTRFPRRSSSLGAPTRTNNNNSNTIEEEKEGEKLGGHGFIHYMCPWTPTLPANDSKPTQPEKFDEEKLSTSSDGSDKRVFPVSDPEIVQLDESQHDHVEDMKKHDDSKSFNVEKPEGGNYKKSKSTGTLLRRWSFKGLLRRSSSEHAAPRSINNIEEGVENPGMFSRCFSLSSRSSSKLNLEGEKLGSDGCILHLCPCLSSLPPDSTQRPREADQEKVAVLEKKPSFKCSTGSSGHESKNNNSADLGKVDGYSKRPKLQNNAHKVYLKKNSESWKAASTPYRQETIGFFAMVRPLVILFTASTRSG